MDIDLQGAYDEIMQATCAEDLFGDLTNAATQLPDLALLEKKYAHFLHLVDPAIYKSSPDDAEAARDAKDRLDQFCAKAKQRINELSYGYSRSSSFSMVGRTAFETKKRKYLIGPPIAEGDISTVYEGEGACGDDFAGRVAIKIVNESRDNDLLRNEARVLKIMQEAGGNQRKHLPVLLDQFLTTEGQAGTITRLLTEFYDFPSIHAKPDYTKGIPEKHMVWILNRLLSAVGYAHSLGIIHGNIEPNHLLIRPRDHNLVILGWTGAVISPAKTGDVFKLANDDFSAPEVFEKETPLPSADLYSIGLCMIYILGGDIETKTLPDTVNEELQRFIKFFVMDSPLQRAQDAWQMWGMLEKLIVRLWGKKKFLDFRMA